MLNNYEGAITTPLRQLTGIKHSQTFDVIKSPANAMYMALGIRKKTQHRLLALVYILQLPYLLLTYRVSLTVHTLYT